MTNQTPAFTNPSDLKQLSEHQIEQVAQALEQEIERRRALVRELLAERN